MTLIAVALLAAALVWYGSGVFDRPATRYEIGSPADGRRAQQKLFELGAGSRLRRGEARSVTVSEREINALLARHLSGERLPLAEPGLRLVGNGVVEITGRLPLRAVSGDTLSAIFRYLPEGWAERPVWLTLRGQVRLETGATRGDRRRLQLDVETAWLGSRRVPAFVLGLLPEGPVRRATRWPVAESVEAVTVEGGQVTVSLRP